MSYRSMMRSWTCTLAAAGLMLALSAIPATAQQGSAASGSAEKQRAKPADRGAGEQITDAWILTKVKSQFVGEDALEHSDINVDVRDHVVILKGTVASAAGKQRAEEIARKTDGVTRVDNRLIVGVAKKDAKDATKSAKESARDATKEADKSAKEMKEDAKASGQQAKDKASETTREAREEAKQSAGKTKDAAGDAVGTTGAAVTDSWITTKVKSSFVGVDVLEGSNIDVDTNHHVVTLRGTVPSEQAKNRAVAIAKKIDGVQSVKSELTVAEKK